jgi:cytochrome c553
MKRLLVGLLVLAASTAAGSQTAAPNVAADAAAGRMLYRDTPLLRGSINACIQCHANPAAQRRGVTLADQQDHIRCAIQGGCGGAQLAVYPLGAMAQFQTLLDADDIRRLASFIREPAVAAAWPRLQPRNGQAASTPVGGRAAIALAVENRGEAALTISRISIEGRDAAEFALPLAGCGAPALLAPGASCPLEVAFAPACAAPRQAVVLVHHDGPLSPSRASVQGEGVGTAVPLLGILPERLDFAASGTGSLAASLTVSNRCAGQLVLGEIGVEGPFERVAEPGGCAAGRVLGPAESCQLTLRRLAGAAGLAGGAVVVTDVSSGSITRVPVVAAALSGPVLEAERLPAAPDSLTTLGESRQLVAASLVNRGAAPASVLALSSDSPEFVVAPVAPGACAAGATLAPGAACALTVRFEPAQAGERRATLSVEYADVEVAAVPMRLSLDVAAQGAAPTPQQAAPAADVSGGGSMGLIGMVLMSLFALALRRLR